jgi:hypothetical protein
MSPVKNSVLPTIAATIFPSFEAPLCCVLEMGTHRQFHGAGTSTTLADPLVHLKKVRSDRQVD